MTSIASLQITFILYDNPAFSIFFIAIFARSLSISIVMSFPVSSGSKFPISIAEYPCKVPISSINVGLYFFIISDTILPFTGPIEGRCFILAICSNSLRRLDIICWASLFLAIILNQTDLDLYTGLYLLLL